MPTISVIIPLFNKEKHIYRALSSVLQQTFTDYEVVVVDDGSTDNGAEVVRGLGEPRIRLIQQYNSGVSAARNRGIAESKGELIAFLDADDEWRPGFLATVQGLHSRFPHAGAYATAYKIKQENHRAEMPRFSGFPPAPWEGEIPNYFKSLSGDLPVCASSAAVRRDVFRDIGSFAVGERLGEDTDMWGRIAIYYPIVFSWKVGAVYHNDATNMATKTYYLSDDLPFVKTARRLMSAGQIPREMLPDVLTYMYREQVRTARDCFCYGKNGKLARSFLPRFRCAKGCRERYLWWYLWSYMPPAWSPLALKSKEVLKALHGIVRRYLVKHEMTFNR